MTTALTETAINKARREAVEHAKRADLADPGQPGLRLRIAAGGTCLWTLVCRDSSGQVRRFSLGAYPGIGLAQARRDARGLREDVRKGRDPTAEKRARKAKAEARKNADTLVGLLDLYERQGTPPARSWPEYRRCIERVFAGLLKTPLDDLTVGDVQMAADKWPAKQSAAAAVRCLRPTLKWAAAPGRGYVARDLILITPPDTVKRRHRVVSRDELAALAPVLADHVDPYAAASRLMLLTLARREEVCGATWGEIDLKQALWTIPAGRVKADQAHARQHIVPLSKQAVALLRAIRPARAAAGTLIFSTATGKPLGNWDRSTKRLMIAAGLARRQKLPKGKRRKRAAVDAVMIDGSSIPTRHDLRRTAATMLGELGFEPHVVEAALNHTHVGGQLASLYNQSRYRPEVAKALQSLSDVIDGIYAGIVTLKQLKSRRQTSKSM